MGRSLELPRGRSGLSSPRSKPAWPSAARRLAAIPPRSTTSSHLIYRAEDPIDNVLTQAEQYRQAGLDLAILYPFSPIDPASVHDMADALEPIVGAG